MNLADESQGAASGRGSPAGICLDKTDTGLAGADSATRLRHLAGAIAASCLLHGIIILLPYLGGRSSQPTIAAKASIQASRTRLAVLTATFAPVVPAKPQITEPMVATEVAIEERDIAAKETTGPNAEAVPEHAGIAALLPMPSQDYYPADQLTKRPRALGAIELDPPEIQDIVVSGKLILKLWIDDRGNVAEVVVEESGLPEVFSRVAADAFRQSRFRPGERIGKRVGSIMRVEVAYDDSRLQRR